MVLKNYPKHAHLPTSEGTCGTGIRLLMKTCEMLTHKQNLPLLLHSAAFGNQLLFSTSYVLTPVQFWRGFSFLENQPVKRHPFEAKLCKIITSVNGDMLVCIF